MCMKKYLLFIAFIGFGLIADAADSAPNLRLSGILSYSTNAYALFEDPAQPSHQLLLSEGQSSGRLSVIKIDPVTAKVEIHNAGAFSELTFSSAVSNSIGDTSSRPAASLRLEQAGGPVLYLYQLLTRRTMIPSPSLPPFRVDLQMPQARDEKELAAGIEKALAQKGILVQTEKNKFALVITEADQRKITPELWDLAAMLQGRSERGHSSAGSVTNTPSDADEMLPPGFINFLGADLSQVLLIYQDLASRTLLRPATLPPASIWLRTATTVSRAEALFAFNLVLALNDLSLKPVGENFLLIVPAAQSAKASALLSRTMPVHPMADKKPLPAWTLNLRGTGTPEIVALYKSLCGQPVIADDQLPDLRLMLANSTPLTPAEGLFALDFLLAWNDVTTVPQPGGTDLKLTRALSK